MITLDSRTRAKLIWIGAMCAPIVAVQGVRSLLGTGPAPAAAAAPAEPPMPTVTPQTLTDRQREALKWLMNQGARPPERSPMDRPLPIVRSAPGGPEIESPPVEDDRPKNVRVTSIIGDGTAALAAINHRVRRVGDEIAPGWRIERIDSRSRAVFVRHTDGRTIRYAPETPAP